MQPSSPLVCLKENVTLELLLPSRTLSASLARDVASGCERLSLSDKRPASLSRKEKTGWRRLLLLLLRVTTETRASRGRKREGGEHATGASGAEAATGTRTREHQNIKASILAHTNAHRERV